jgi:hypothetical protein
MTRIVDLTIWVTVHVCLVPGNLSPEDLYFFIFRFSLYLVTIYYLLFIQSFILGIVGSTIWHKILGYCRPDDDGHFTTMFFHSCVISEGTLSACSTACIVESTIHTLGMYKTLIHKPKIVKFLPCI